MLSHFQIIYISIIGAIGILFFIFIRLFLNKIEKKRISELKDLKRFDVVKSKKKITIAKKQKIAISKLGSRFSNIRHIFLVIFFLSGF